MSGLPIAWEMLRREVNGLPGFVGQPGVRDPDGLCEAFDGAGYDGTGNCDSDGHYLCVECSHLSPEAPRFEENYGRAGSGRPVGPGSKMRARGPRASMRA